jgi:integrase
MARNAPTYLAVSRHGLFYFRMSVPTALRAPLGTRELKHSLKTRHRRTAIQWARRCATHYDALFATLQEHPVTYLEIKQLLQAAKAALLEDLTRALERNGPLTWAGRSEVVGELKVLRTLVAGGDYPPKARATADAVLANANIQLTPDSPTHRQFCVETAKMLDSLWQAYLAHSEVLDGYTEAVTPATPPVAPVPAPAAHGAQSAPAAPSVCVRQVVEAYCAEKQREGSWTEKTEQEHRAVFDLFTKVTGDCPVETITVDTARDYKAVLVKLPANLNKNPLYRGKSIEQVLAMKPQQTMAVNTVNKNLTRVSALFAWAKRHGYVRDNYFEGLALKKNKRPHEERAAFTHDELAALFGTDQYRRHRFLHPHYYWLPLLGLYTGARLEELCQLHLDDIREVDGVWVFDINDNGEKKLKTPANQRLIPVHPKLIALGFLHYVETLRNRNATRLFPRLARGRDGYSQAASRWFSRYREPLGLHNQTPRKDFHSFRHTFVNTFKQQGVDEGHVAALIGHSKGGITFERYGKPYVPAFLVDVIKRLSYDDALTAVKPFF